jgi:hypothetical protein
MCYTCIYYFNVTRNKVLFLHIIKATEPFNPAKPNLLGFLWRYWGQCPSGNSDVHSLLPCGPGTGKVKFSAHYTSSMTFPQAAGNISPIFHSAQTLRIKITSVDHGSTLKNTSNMMRRMLKCASGCEPSGTEMCGCIIWTSASTGMMNKWRNTRSVHAEVINISVTCFQMFFIAEPTQIQMTKKHVYTNNNA